MHKVTPAKHEDGTETVTLYGTVVDVTGLKKFTLFKKEYKVYRPRKKKEDLTIEDNGVVIPNETITPEVTENE